MTHPISRRHFLAAAGATAVLAAADKPRDLLYISEADAGRMRDALPGARTAILERNAARALTAGPWSVTFERPKGLNVHAGPHDYVSEGPYWWPDPKDPKAPYIRKDGQRNPERFNGNRTALGDMCTAVLSLGMGAFFLKKPECAQRANRVLGVWFVDPATRMNPNLDHGQMVRGHNEGRGTGIIDTVSFIHAAQGVALVEAAGGLDASTGAGVRQWFGDYLKWMMESKPGLDEKKSGNNHATWWTAQAATYAALTGNASALRMAWEHYRTYLVPTEIKPDGSCPREEERTNSLGYSSMNLDAFTTLCRLAQAHGVDLWHFKTSAGQSVERAVRYLTPYVAHPDTWKKQQIGKYSADGYVFPGLAGIGLPATDLLKAYVQLPRSESPWVQFVDLLVRSAGVRPE
jgi:hypothetical protein